MGANTKIYNKFGGYTIANCKCTLCQYYRGKRRGCALSHSECCCTEEKIGALMREYGLGQEDAERFVAENRGVADKVISTALLTLA